MGDRINIFVDTNKKKDKEKVRDSILDKLKEIKEIYRAEADFGFFKKKKVRLYNYEREFDKVPKRAFDELYGKKDDESD